MGIGTGEEQGIFSASFHFHYYLKKFQNVTEPLILHIYLLKHYTVKKLTQTVYMNK